MCVAFDLIVQLLYYGICYLGYVQPVGLEDYSNEEGEIDVLAYMENLSEASGSSDDSAAGDVRARGRSRSVYK